MNRDAGIGFTNDQPRTFNVPAGVDCRAGDGDFPAYGKGLRRIDVDPGFAQIVDKSAEKFAVNRVEKYKLTGRLVIPGLVRKFF